MRAASCFCLLGTHHVIFKTIVTISYPALLAAIFPCLDLFHQFGRRIELQLLFAGEIDDGRNELIVA